MKYPYLAGNETNVVKMLKALERNLGSVDVGARQFRELRNIDVLPEHGSVIVIHRCKDYGHFVQCFSYRNRNSLVRNLSRNNSDTFVKAIVTPLLPGDTESLAGVSSAMSQLRLYITSPKYRKFFGDIDPQYGNGTPYLNQYFEVLGPDHDDESTKDLFAKMELQVGDYGFTVVPNIEKLSENCQGMYLFVFKYNGRYMVMASRRSSKKSVDTLYKTIEYGSDGEVAVFRSMIETDISRREAIASLAAMGYNAVVDDEGSMGLIRGMMIREISDATGKALDWDEIQAMLSKSVASKVEVETDESVEDEVDRRLGNLAGFKVVPGGYMFAGRQGKRKILTAKNSSLQEICIDGLRTIAVNPTDFKSLSGGLIQVCHSPKDGHFLEVYYTASSEAFRLRHVKLSESLNHSRGVLVVSPRHQFDNSIDFRCYLAEKGFPVLLEGLDQVAYLKAYLLTMSGNKDWNEYYPAKYDRFGQEPEVLNPAINIDLDSLVHEVKEDLQTKEKELDMKPTDTSPFKAALDTAKTGLQAQQTEFFADANISLASAFKSAKAELDTSVPKTVAGLMDMISKSITEEDQPRGGRNYQSLFKVEVIKSLLSIVVTVTRYGDTPMGFSATVFDLVTEQITTIDPSIGVVNEHDTLTITIE